VIQVEKTETGYMFTLAGHSSLDASPQSQTLSRLGATAFRERIKKSDEIAEWCRAEFGPNSVRGCWTYSRSGVFYIDDESLAMMFRLRWC
jgi:hypothetical protein